MIPPLQEAKDAGIKIIGIDGDLSDTSDHGDQHPVRQPGRRRAGRQVARRGRRRGRGRRRARHRATTPGVPIGEQREQGFTDELAKYPAINYLGMQYSNNAAGQGGDHRVDDAPRRTTTWSACTRWRPTTPRARSPGCARPTRRPRTSRSSATTCPTRSSRRWPTARSPASSSSTRTARAARRRDGRRPGQRAGGAAQPGRRTSCSPRPDNVDTPEVQQFIYKLDCG